MNKPDGSRPDARDDTLAVWLSDLGLPDYLDAFQQNDIDLEALALLNADHLKELGVSLGHRVKMLNAISNLRKAARDPTAQPTERRHLTVVFIDLVGSTALSSRFDPEDMRDLLLTYRDAVGACVARYEGHIAQFLGDGILVYFGWPRSQGKDAERAIRAGLDAIKAVAQLSAPDGSPMAARIGMATGLVVVGNVFTDGSSQEQSAIGETPNLAARLQGLAEPNQMVIDGATRSVAGGEFDLTNLGPQSLKGISEDTQVWRVNGEKSSQAKAAIRQSLVGRDRELQTLRRAWADSRAGEGRIVAIQGEAGIGKSHLVGALSDRIGFKNCLRISLQCSAAHQNTTLYPVTEFLKRVIGWRAADDEATKLIKLRRRLAGTLTKNADWVELLTALLARDADDAQPRNLTSLQLRRRTFDAIVDWLLVEARHRPVLLVLEDIHWADPSTLELLEMVAGRVRAAPIFTVLTRRTGGGSFEHEDMAVLTLDQLDGDDLASLVSQVPGASELPQEWVRSIVGKSDGVPLFAEELTKAILSRNDLPAARSGGARGARMIEQDIPATLQESLSAQLDQSKWGRQTAQLASVIGREFSLKLLKDIGSVPEEGLHAGLASLIQARLISRRGERDQQHFLFRHALIRDAAYQTLLKSSRRQLHRKVVDAVVGGAYDIYVAEPEWVAEHCIEAGALDEGALYLERAGRRATERSSFLEAREHLSRCLDLLGRLGADDDRLKRELSVRMLLGSVLIHTAGEVVREREESYERAREICAVLGDSRKMINVLVNLQRLYATRGDSPKARQTGEELLVQARASNDKGLYIQACNSLGIDLFYTGDFAAATKVFEDGAAPDIAGEELAISLEYGYDVRLHCLNWMSWSEWMLGRVDEASRLSEEALAQANGHPHPYSKCSVFHWAAVLSQFRQDPDAVSRHSLALAALSAEHEVPQWQASAKLLQGWATGRRENPARGLALMEEGYDAWCAIGVETARPYWLALIADVCAAGGFVERGLEALDRAHAQVSETGEAWWGAELHRLSGELLARRERQVVSSVITGHFETAMAIASEQGATELRRRAVASFQTFEMAQTRVARG